jgi:hypothetical protein
MTNLDKLLLKLLADNAQELEAIPERDLKVLKSLAKLITTPTFITENQGRLLIKILSENINNFTSSKSQLSLLLEAPTWSQSFRIVDRTKKLFIDSAEAQIVVEFAFSSAIRKMLNGISKRITGFFQQHAGKYYRADLTEKNIVVLVEELTPLGFDIDQKLLDFYNIIKSWSETDVRSQYFLTNITHTNFQKQITADLGLETAIDENIINDRSVRYQYILEKPRKTPENLTETIANRTGSKVWVNKKEVRLDQVISSLLKLQRLPTLMIFDSNDHKKCFEELELLNESLEGNGIFDQVGIYFRLPNDEHGASFNKLIADRGYNYNLDSSTKIVGVQNGKIPKFFLKTDWKPMSVITIGNTLKQTKTAVYANYCDLIISYTDTQPIIESRALWE